MARSDFRFYHQRRVEYADIDAQGYVFWVNYLKYFDTAVTEYMRFVGYDYLNESRESGEDFHAVKASVEFKAPVHYDDLIDVHVRASRLGRSSLSFALELYRTGEDDLLVQGEVIWVNADQKTKRSAPVPSSFVDRIVEKEGTAILENLPR